MTATSPNLVETSTCAGKSQPVDLDAYVRRLVDQSVPLSAEQRDRLSLLLRGAGAVR